MPTDRQHRYDMAAFMERSATVDELVAEDDANEALRAEKACGAEVDSWYARTGCRRLRDTPLHRENRRVEALIDKAYRAHRDRIGTREERRALTAQVVRATRPDEQPTLVLPVSRLRQRPEQQQRRKAA